MRLVLLSLALTLTAALTACSVAPVPQPGPGLVTRAGGAQPGFAQMLNDIRAAHGLSPAAEDPLLTAAAQGHAQDMAAQGYIAHQGRDGSDHMRRIRAAGYCTSYAVENLAWDWPSVERVAQEWSHSAKHLENMLLSGAVEYGLGVADERYVLVLARPC